MRQKKIPGVFIFNDKRADFLFMIICVCIPLLVLSGVLQGKESPIQGNSTKQSPKRILVYVQYADVDEELLHTMFAINSMGMAYERTDLTNYTLLDTHLANKDVLLIPEQESASPSQLQTIGSVWASTLYAFVNNGGVVIQCECYGQYQILSSSGLLTITGYQNVTGKSLTIADLNHPITQGVTGYEAQYDSSSYVCSEGEAVVQTSGGSSVVIHKKMGYGDIVAIGHDYYRSNSQQDRILGNAVFNLPYIADDLVIFPYLSQEFKGNGGGPFYPDSISYKLENTGSSALDWKVTRTQNWLDITPANGTLASGETIKVRCSLNDNALSLPGGKYQDDLTFTNITSGVARERKVYLWVEAPAVLPFQEDFESGDLNTYWKKTGTNYYRMEVETSYSPHGGSYHLLMDSAVNRYYSRNELTLLVNLQNYTGVQLSFWAKEFDDEPNGPPPSPFIYGADFDGVAVSEDGHSWYEVQSLRELTDQYQQITFDLDAAIASLPLNYNSLFRIRFNQYDDLSINRNGIAIDDIQIAGTIKDYLFIDPYKGYMVSGEEGGAFAPECKKFSLQNKGSEGLSWDVTHSQTWLDISPTSGTLSPGETIDVEVCINDQVPLMKIGVCDDTLIFTNKSTGIAFSRDVKLYVMPAGISPDIITVPLDYPTIQEAIDAANEGDKIMVMPGRYRENVNFRGRNVSLSSMKPADAKIVEETIIDGMNSGPAVSFSGRENTSCLIAGFTITGASSYGGVWGNGAGPTIKHNRIMENQASGIYACHGLIQDNLISNNEGIFLSGGIHYCNGNIVHNTITDNYTHSNGGGLSGCDGFIRDNIITKNTSEDNGGGLYDCHGIIVNNIISDNIAGSDGGGMSYCNALARNNIISNNTAENGGGLSYCEGDILGNEVFGNWATGPSGSGGGIDNCTGDIVNNILHDNYAYWKGGGIATCGGTLEGNIIYNNEALYGGGVSDSDGILRNNTIYGNIAMVGGGLNRCLGQIENCILWQNTAAALEDQYYFCSVPQFCCIEDYVEGGEGNISADPLFAGPEAGDFHLQAGSPCIDAGNPAPQYDDSCLPPGLGGARNDMGAYGGSLNCNWIVEPMLADLTQYGDVWGASCHGFAPFETPSRRAWLGFKFDPVSKWLPLSGNADGSGFKDLIQVTEFGDVWVSINAGYELSAPSRWGWLGFRYSETEYHGWLPLTGDVNGDGADDLIQVTEYGDVWTALSVETMYEPPVRWGWLGYRFNRAIPGTNGAIPLSGDANGDGADDLIQVTEYGDAWTALSAETIYEQPARWGWLGFKYAPYDGWYPLCGDVNGDGLDDLVQITPSGDPWVSLSTGFLYDAPTRWGWLGFYYDEAQGYYPLLGDVNGDGKDDLIQITPLGEVWVALSRGDSFDYPEYWGALGFLFSREKGYLPFFLDY